MIAENGEMFDLYRNEPEDIIEAGDDKIVVVIRSAARGRLSGIEVQGRLAHLWTLRDGKAIRFEAFASREDALSAASSD
jgi:ketosteroid isomerase-like protein